MKLDKNTRIAVVCRGGPENLFFCAQALDTIFEVFEKNNYLYTPDLFAVSATCPVALLGCIRETKKLCNILKNIRPENIINNVEEFKGIGGLIKIIDKLIQNPFNLDFWRMFIKEKNKKNNIRNILRLLENLKNGYIISNSVLYELLKKELEHELDRIFGSDSSLVKLIAVDELTGQKIVFSNKVPEHKEVLIRGIIGSMGLVPYFPSTVIDKASDFKLTDTNYLLNKLFLIDGGYKTSLPVEEAMREETNYDIILVMDIQGVKIKEIPPIDSNILLSRTLRALHIRSATHDQLILSIHERINEEIFIRDKLKEIENYLTILNSDNYREKSDINQILLSLRELVNQMNNGRLRLYDKKQSEIFIVSNPDVYKNFDFTNFTQAEALHLMRAGHNAALKLLKKLGFNLCKKDIPLIKP
jgi:predicted acylesterase/phospholipase RssA